MDSHHETQLPKLANFTQPHPTCTAYYTVSESIGHRVKPTCGTRYIFSQGQFDGGGMEKFDISSFLTPRLRNLTPTKVSLTPVSYTHLTLPTICSV